ncbi:TIGR01212 family radical SAM protein [Lachnotalea glycerini]|nr:TIGR01212 family radical SAM protein [Lachnotalea glycerini]
MEEKMNRIYYSYSEYLVRKYGAKVYKLPINLPITCPNRIESSGCTFCSEKGTGFEAQENTKSVSSQILENMEYISKRYKAKKFIAYFQNYTNTFMPVDLFEKYMYEAALLENIVEIAVSTRPDCINDEYLSVLRNIERKYHIEISIELGLQTVNYHTLDKINRGHGLAEYIDAVLKISQYGFEICTHVILNLPYDNNRDVLETAKIISALPVHAVKIHSLYIPKDTVMCTAYEAGKITLCTKDEYLEKLIIFIEHLRPEIVVERLFSRIPEQDSEFSNWNTSWWKLKDEFVALMKNKNSYQGIAFDYLNGAALARGGYCFGIKK